MTTGYWLLATGYFLSVLLPATPAHAYAKACFKPGTGIIYCEEDRGLITACGGETTGDACPPEANCTEVEEEDKTCADLQDEELGFTVEEGAAGGPAAGAGAGEEFKFKVPEGDFPTIFGRIIRAILGITGSLAFASIVYGGFLWLTSAGAPETITKAKNIVVWSALGLAMIFASYAIVSNVFSALSESAGVQLRSPQE